MIGLLRRARAESVVRVEAMRLDDEIAHARVGVEVRVDDRFVSRGAPLLIEQVSDGLCTKSASLMGATKCEVEFCGAVEIEQLEQSRSSAAHVSTLESDLGEEVFRGRTCSEEAVFPAVLTGLSFGLGEECDVGFVLDLLPCVVGATMTRDLD
jgi:hypothetical protein